MPQSVPTSISDGLARLWIRFLPDIQQRVAVIEATAQALRAGSLSSEERHAAHAAAHKLAGTLGTFGLHRGTDLARQLEEEFAGEVPASAVPDLCLWIAELRSLIDERK
jgi:HPt (histidine-containing phosphotransfer) domain-containing protein